MPAAAACASSAASVPAPPAPDAPVARSKKAKILLKEKAVAAAASYHPIKGTHDALPLLAGRQRACESLFASIAQSYMYCEIRTPILERTELFQRTLGEASDVVSKEMFAFEDHGTNTVLRPENTASQSGRKGGGGRMRAGTTSAQQGNPEAREDCAHSFLSCSVLFFPSRV